MRLRARVANPRGELSPGLFARVQVVVQRRQNALLMPESAVFLRDDQPFVYRMVEGRAMRTAVVLGQRRPGVVEIRQGLAPDAQVITAGQQRLRDGALVKRTPAAQPAAAASRGG